MTTNVGAIVLAAGASTRLGEPKQLVRVNGKTLLRRAAETALLSRCRPVVVVLGATASLFYDELRGLELSVVENKSWADGMGSSIRCGIETLLSIDSSLDAALIMLCDQPFVSTELLNRLVNTSVDERRQIVACDYGGAVGVPAVFSKRVFSDILRLNGNDGAKKIILSRAYSTIPFSDGAFDIDTPSDVAKLQRAFSESDNRA